ncbi:MAG: ABC transporter substrate-binding protein [Spirochaetaceae bacterium]|jgi:branched-chain amino acid transport system substrate-binding protein|nr:ABC transporter substrate-binding protein [Spirochaetaceae bacterium]
MKIFCKILISVTAAALLAGCAKKDTIKIGVFEPLTGANAAGGAIELEGIRLANKLYPKITLGEKTYDIELVVADNKSDKVESANAVLRLITKDKVPLILGSWGSSLAIAGGEIAKDENVPIIGLSCTNPLVTARNDWYFRVCFIDPFQGTVMANYAYNDIGAKNAVIVREISNDYSVGLSPYFADKFVELTGNTEAILAIVDYGTGDQDFSAQLTRVKELNPDVIFAPGNFTESALVIQQARSLGINAPFIGGDTWETGEFLDVGGESVEGAVFSSFYDSSVADDGIAKTFLTEYVNEYQKNPAAVTALGFDGYLLALDAIQRAGSTDPTAIRDALASTDGFEGVTGVIVFDENGDATKPAFIKEVRDGIFVFKTIVAP